MEETRQSYPWCRHPGLGQHGPEVKFHERDVVLFQCSSKPSQPGMYFRRLGLTNDPDFCKAHYFDGHKWVDPEGNEIDQTLQWYALKNDPTERVFAKQMGRVFDINRMPKIVAASEVHGIGDDKP